MKYKLFADTADIVLGRLCRNLRMMTRKGYPKHSNKTPLQEVAVVVNIIEQENLLGSNHPHIAE